MFIFTKNTKELIVTTGVVISCCLFVAQSVKWVYIGGYSLILSFLSLLLTAAILKGVKLGYIVARFIFGGVAVSSFLVAFNPFAYLDIRAAQGSITHFIFEILLITAISSFLFYCLGEHAKLRKLRSEQKEFWQYRITHYIFGGVAIILVFNAIFTMSLLHKLNERTKLKAIPTSH